MAYIGKRKIADVAPNHPFAHDQISFVLKRGDSPSSSSGTPPPGPSAPAPDATNSMSDPAMMKRFQDGVDAHLDQLRAEKRAQMVDPTGKPDPESTQ